MQNHVSLDPLCKKIYDGFVNTYLQTSDDLVVLTTFQNFLTRTKMLRQGDWKLVQRPSGTSDWIEEPHLASYTHSEHYQAGTSCFRNIKIHKISNCLLKTSKSSQAILVPLCRPGQRPLPQSQQMQHTCST